MLFSRSEPARARGLVALTLLAATSLTVIVNAQETKPAEAKPRKVPTAARVYKNIQVLKDLPADQLIPTMRGFTAALGVRCGACHVVGADRQGFELDTKPMKRTARAMIRMVRDINKREKVIGGRATCFMCHHGQEEPQTQPAPGAEGTERRPERPGD